MRILASNPDTLGDMVLRQPMYHALLAAGHELTMIVRPSVAPLVTFVAPGASILLLPTEVYRDDLEQHWDLFAQLFERVRALAPAVLLIAPYQWTRFEEKLAEELKGASDLRIFGMSGRLYAGDPHAGHAPPSRLTFDVTVNVDEDRPEVEKNAALAASVLGVPEHALAAVEPLITPDEAVLGSAAQIMERLGLVAGEFWIACVSGTVNVPIKTWPIEHWARVLSHWAQHKGRRFLFVGLPEERQIAEQVQSAMGDFSDSARVWMEEKSALAPLIGLTALSAGYIGHDTGPMHMAAALGKPVLALFGGGHKRRFFPRSRPASPATLPPTSIALTVGVPCAGCAWTCAFQTSHCVKAVPVEQVIAAMEKLESDPQSGPDARVLAPDGPLLDRMVREAAEFARKQLRDSGDLSNQLRHLNQWTVAPMRVELEQRSAEAASMADRLRESASTEIALRSSVQSLATRQDDLTETLRHQKAELESTVSALETRDLEAESLRLALSASKDSAERLGRRVIDLQVAADASGSRAVQNAGRDWRRIIAEWVIGRRNFVPWRGSGALPKITLVTPVVMRTSCPCLGGLGAGAACADCQNASIEAARQTIASALDQEYPRLDFVLAPYQDSRPPTADASDWSKPFANYKPRIARILAPAASRSEAVARALAKSDADVVGWLEPGDLLETGALANVGRFFRNHPGAQGAVFEDVAEIGGWRFPLPRRIVDVPGLLRATPQDAPMLKASVFMRRRRYMAVGQLDPAFGEAAEWELWLRFSRAHRMWHGTGQVTRRRMGMGASGANFAAAESAAAARAAFQRAIGVAGRVRCQLIHWNDSITSALKGLSSADRLFFPLHPAQMSLKGPAAHISGRPPPQAPTRLNNPTTGEPAERMLFSVPPGFDESLRVVCYGSDTDIAWVETVRAQHVNAASQLPAPCPAAPAPCALPSPYAGYRRRRWARMTGELPCPFSQAHPGFQPGEPADPLLSVVVDSATTLQRPARVLQINCGDGALLDTLRGRLRASLCGTEIADEAASVARQKGYAIWRALPEDAASVIPVGQSFNLIILDRRDDRSALASCDLLSTLRRLHQLLVPGGMIVLTGPNLDSVLVDFFGPNWAGWDAGERQEILGRRGLHRLGRLADLRLSRFKTRTEHAAATLNLHRNRLGLGPDIGDPPLAGEDHAMGKNLAAWCRLIWDPRGRGDTYYAVLRSS